MPELPKIKIQKTKYSFDVKKRYQYVKHYKVQKKSPIELFQETVKKLFEQKKPAAKPTPSYRKTAEKPSGGLNAVVIGVAIFIAIMVILGAWVFLTLPTYETASSKVTASLEKPTITNTLFDGDVITAGDRYVNMNSAIFGLRYNASGLDNYTAMIYTYDKKIYSEVFLLRSDFEDSGDYSNFVSALRTEFEKRGVVLNEITINDLESMPETAVVIVPTGYLPYEILGGGDSSITPDKLAERGIVIIYVGRPFSKVYKDGVVINTPEELKKNIPFDFDERAMLQSQGISLYQPLYTVSGRNWGSSLTHGSVSVVTKGDGAFVFFPQSLSGGWQAKPEDPTKAGYQYAAEDIATVALEMPWASPDGDPKIYNLEPTANSIYLLTNDFKGNEKSVLVWFYGTKKIGDQTIDVVDRKVIRVSKQTNGAIFLPSGNAIVPSSISGQNVRFYISLAEPQAQQLNFNLEIINDSGEIATSAPIPLGRLSTQTEKELDVPLNLPRGEYLVAVVDDAGKRYAATYLSVSSIAIKYLGKGKEQSSYMFSISMDGKPIQLNEVTVSVDNGKYGSHTIRNVIDKVEVNVKDYTGGDALPPGNHSFKFKVGELEDTYYLNIETPQIPFFSNPLFLGAIVLSLIILGVGFVFARKEEAAYAIDIPDFPPIAREKITLSSDVILSIFEKVNENYKWKYTPLKLNEIKNGFKDIYYKGRPIYLTDYNAESILQKMKKQGKIVQFLDYYAPKMWEERIKKPIQYLAMMRALRDICINNATPFTGLDESDKADSEIDVMGQKMFVHFYYNGVDLQKLFKKIFENTGEGISIVLFENDLQKAAFKKLLLSPTKAQTIMKLEVESNTVQLLTIEELEKMIKELRAI